MLVNLIKNILSYFCFILVIKIDHKKKIYFGTHSFHIGVTSVYVLSFIIWTLLTYPNKSDAQMYVEKRCLVFSQSFVVFFFRRIHSIILCIESCLFGLFVVAIFIDQVQSITSDRSIIDTLKSSESARSSPQALPPAKVLFRRVFGPGKFERKSFRKDPFLFQGPMIFWLIPCDLKKSNQITDSQNMYHV